jgi:hypothetical protein
MCTEGRDKDGKKGRPMAEAVLAIEHVGKYLGRLAARK